MAFRLHKASGPVLAALAFGCVTGQPTTVTPTGGGMTTSQLSATLAGNSVVAVKASGGASYCAFHSTEATTANSLIVRGTDGGAPYRGLYRVEPQPNADDPNDPGFVCYSYPDAGIFADCKMMRTTGAQVAVLSRTGQLFATGEIRPGNACGVIN